MNEVQRLEAIQEEMEHSWMRLQMMTMEALEAREGRLLEEWLAVPDRDSPLAGRLLRDRQDVLMELRRRRQ